MPIVKAEKVCFTFISFLIADKGNRFHNLNKKNIQLQEITTRDKKR
jgi:hypothetical protein